jgi:hypothetical protein
MAARARGGKFHGLFTLFGAFSRCREVSGVSEGIRMVGGIAIAMFVALVGWGGRYFGWDDPSGKVQLALVTSFILGIIGGFKSRG